MLLTCNSCRNTYVIDDATLQASGGVAQCEQCQEPLVPLGGGAKKDSTTVLDGYSFENLEAQWRKNQLAPGAEGPPPAAAGFQPPPASVPQYGAPPGYPAYPPPGPQPPAPAQGWGAPAPAAPLPTQALSPVASPEAAGPPSGDMFIAPSERTMAIDLDSMSPAPEAPAKRPQPAAVPAPSGVQAKGPMSTGRVDARQAEAQAKRQQVIVGAAQVQHNEKTAAIDASGIDSFMAAQARGGAPSVPGAPGVTGQQPMARPVPGRSPVAPPPAPQQGGGKGVIIGVIALFGLLLVAGIIVVVVLFVLADDKKSSGGGSDESEETQLTFAERITEARSAPSMLMLPPVHGHVLEKGVIVTVSAAEGVYVEANLVVPYNDGQPSPQHTEGGVPYLTELAAVLQGSDADVPIVLLFDQGLTMDGVFPVVFTATATGREVLVGGDSLLSPGMVSGINLLPYGWPAPPTGTLPPSSDTDLRLAIDPSGITVTGKDVNPDGVKKNEVRIQKLAGTYDLSNLTKALAAAKSASPGNKAVRFSPRRDLGFGTLIEVVQNVRGEDFNFPRFTTLYLEAPR